MRKEVETHNPKWEEVYEGSGVVESDQGVLNLRWIAEAYLWRETGSWNGGKLYRYSQETEQVASRKFCRGGIASEANAQSNVCDMQTEARRCER